jgi:hypothetical protein
MKPSAPASARFTAVMGTILLAGAAIWMGAMALDGMGLEENTGSAVVTGKSHRDAGSTYTREIINNRSYTVARGTPEVYALLLELEGTLASGAVNQGMWDTTAAGDSVRVKFRRRRLTHGIEILAVTKP